MKITPNKNVLILRELTIAHKHIQQHSTRIRIRILTYLRKTGVKVKVKQSHYRPGGTQRVPEN